MIDETFKRLRDFAQFILEHGSAHLDNTGTQCRLDLGGHDCCYACNVMADLAKSIEAHDMDAEGIASHVIPPSKVAP